MDQQTRRVMAAIALQTLIGIGISAPGSARVMRAAGGPQGSDPAGSIAQPASPTRSPDLRITVRVFNHARVQGATLEEAQKVAARIFEEAGIKIDWHDCLPGAQSGSDPICDEGVAPDDVVVRIAPRIRPVPGVGSDTTLGFALGPFATVSYGRVMELGENMRRAPFVILGRAVTHEIGHTLLRTSGHSPDGIMRARWGPNDLGVAGTGEMFFTPEQSKLLRAATWARIR